MAVWRVTFATAALASNPPLPIAATLDEISGVWSVTFDANLVPGPVNTANWFFRANSTEYDPDTAVAVQNRVQGTSTAGIENVGANVVSFSPPPFDVIENIGLKPAAAFADFPLVVT